MENKVYEQLASKTQSGNVVIKSVFQNTGLKYAESIGGIFSLRVRNSKYHFGNPFSSDSQLVDKDSLIKTNSTKESVVRFINWLLEFDDLNVEVERRKWILQQLKSDNLKNKPIIYYKELGEPSHANALDHLINNWEAYE